MSATKPAPRQAGYVPGLRTPSIALASIFTLLAPMDGFFLLVVVPKWAAVFADIGVRPGLVLGALISAATSGAPYIALVLILLGAALAGSWAIALSRWGPRWVLLAALVAIEVLLPLAASANFMVALSGLVPGP